MQTDLATEWICACLVMGIRGDGLKRWNFGVFCGVGFTGVYKRENVTNLNMWLIVYQLHYNQAVIKKKILRMAQVEPRSPHSLRSSECPCKGPKMLGGEVKVGIWGVGRKRPRGTETSLH